MRDPIEERTTNKFGRLLGAVRELGEDLHGQGAIDLEELRLSVPARQNEAKRLITNGLSQRKTAKKLGVNLATVQRDLGKKVEQNASPRKPPPSQDHLKVTQNASPADLSPERWRLSVKGFAYDGSRLRAYWDREFPEWRTYEIDEETLVLVQQAISEWSEIKTVIERDLK